MSWHSCIHHWPSLGECLCPSHCMSTECVNVCSDTDVHTVASLLKLYLRELPEPVVPWSQYQDFLDCTNNIDYSNAEVCPHAATCHAFMVLNSLFCYGLLLFHLY